MTAGAIDFGKERRPAVLDRVLSMRINVTWEMLLYAAIFAAAFGLRFWDLGARALHHDESIHAQWSWGLLQGSYKHDPIFHGPFYYHVQALVFLIFGASDYTARVSAALFGSALVALPLLLRRRFGAVGTMAAVAFLAFSPTLVYFSRFFREDIYMAFFTMAMVVAMWRYVAEGRDRWLILFALAFTGSMTTKEATYLTCAVFLVFLSVHTGVELARDYLESREMNQGWRRLLLGMALAPVAWAIVALWPFFRTIRKRLGWETLPRPGDVLVLLGTIILPLLSAFLKSPLEHAGIVAKGRLTCTPDMPTNDIIAVGGLFMAMTSAAAFVGLQWRARTWAIAFAASAFVYLTLMTSLWTNMSGLCTGPWGSLDYWLSQQGFARGNQPWFYYDMLMPAYEFLTLGIVIGGLWWSVVRGNAFSRFLVTWLAGVWIALSMAGEKMPWLNTHLALPSALLAAWTVNRAWQAWDPKPNPRNAVTALLAVAAISAGAVIVAVFLPGGGMAVAVVRLVFLLGLAGFAAFVIHRLERRALASVAVAVFIGAMAFFSLRTM
ncbi:MAG TPA: flippase activity-associated protein Agl23, partial [Tepidiformaceae bacterium]